MLLAVLLLEGGGRKKRSTIDGLGTRYSVLGTRYSARYSVHVVLFRLVCSSCKIAIVLISRLPVACGGELSLCRCQPP